MTSGKRIIGIVGFSLGLILFITGGAFSQDTPAKEEAVAAQATEFEGTVKIGLGKYFYLPSAQGLDIVIQGKLDSNGDASALTGKDVRVKGTLLADKPSLFLADTIEMKDASGSYKKAFVRNQDLALADFIDNQARESFRELKVTNAAKNEEWEGQGNKVKVFGMIQKAGNPNEPTYILLTDAMNKEIGKIIVDRFTDYASYYLKKMRLFDRLWFYMNIKGTVDKTIRTKSRELFHADVVFCGLF